MTAADSWMRARGRHRLKLESGPPARPAAPDEQEPRPLVSQGGRSNPPVPPAPTPDDLLRGGRGSSRTIWDRLEG